MATKTVRVISPDWISKTHIAYSCSVCGEVHMHLSNGDFTPRDEFRVSHCRHEQCTHVLRIDGSVPMRVGMPVVRRRPRQVPQRHPYARAK